ncbi:hypothetical protein QBC38DRAFT_46760 [Podospora fimiseda]|uniref:Uncharacterized protein n=1 Tax=Podospora fimiseda TaxID=252190 RepID=A0AAN7GNZ8_9PEZI|nr:hypothetical protein QBC38DRAFT_46760 [Podospora fimiseda]
MSSRTGQPDLGLPPFVPKFPQFSTINHLPAALYTLVDMTPEAFLELQIACESEYAQYETDFTRGNNVTPAPRSNFVGESLRAIVNYHVQMNQEAGEQVNLRLNPTMFIVAFHPNWKKHGVLLVTLDEPNNQHEWCVPDAIKMEAKDSGLLIVSLEVGSNGWEEVHDNFEIDKEEEPRIYRCEA